MSGSTKEKFYKYFEDGLSASEAKSFHRSSLVATTPLEEICEVLANGHINPIDRSIYHLYETWRYVFFFLNFPQAYTGR